MSIDINQIAPRMDWGLEVARGEVQRATGLNRWGFIPTVSSNYETVWELGGTYSYPASAAAQTVTSSAAGTDAGAEITITGLDTDYKPLVETVILNASGVAVTTGEFLRINESRVTNGQTLTGNVTVGVGAAVYSYISAEFGKSLSSVYTVPAGYKAYILSGKITIAKQKEVLAKLMVRPLGGIFTAEGIVGTSGAPYHKDWIIPIALEPRTDIEVRAKAGATTEITTGFEILLVEQT